VKKNRSKRLKAQAGSSRKQQLKISPADRLYSASVTTVWDGQPKSPKDYRIPSSKAAKMNS